MTKQEKTKHLESKIDDLYKIIGIYDKALSSISGLLTLMPHDDEHISSWQAKSALNCISATSQTYAEMAQQELEALND